MEQLEPDSADLGDVRIFVQVVRSESFTGAARLLGLPKSSVSRRVAQLEDALGARLLERTTRRLSLTEAGRSYYARVGGRIDDLLDAGRAIAELDNEPRGVLRVTAPPDIRLSRTIAAYQRRYPQVRVVLYATGARVDLVAEGYDLALRAGELSDSSLIARKLVSIASALFASPGYVAEAGMPEDAAALAVHRCLVFGARETTGTWSLQDGDATREVSVSGPLASNDYGVLRTAAIDGLGIALLPELPAADAVAAGQLVRVLPRLRGPLGALHAVYPSARLVTPKLHTFVDFLQEELQAALARASQC